MQVDKSYQSINLNNFDFSFKTSSGDEIKYVR